MSGSAAALVSFGDLPPADLAALNAIPTRLRLPPEQFDGTIAAVREAVRHRQSEWAACAKLSSQR
ncbi:hypothetical protein O7A70_11905 [Mesorhizobium sp. Cs1299R1N1]|uniref:hypothetical protein n=1 Tax=Mesorhizobium sp. Cs1299R1N1 TaxID=3015172 RepID=UPI00301B7398